MIVSCAPRARVERRACRWERSVAIVDEDVVEILDLGAMALNRAVEALLAHPSVVEHADDRDGTALGPHDVGAYETGMRTLHRLPASPVRRSAATLVVKHCHRMRLP